MSEAARDESRDRVDHLLDGRLAALQPEADRLRAALLRGESPECLGLTEDGLSLQRRYGEQGWSVRRMRAELGVGGRWLVAELARLDLWR
jgi:hypothetical protein